MTNQEDLISNFKNFDFDANDDWKSYLKRLEPTPEGAVLAKFQRKWYSQNVDKNFKPEMMEPKKVIPPSAPKNESTKTQTTPTTRTIPQSTITRRIQDPNFNKIFLTGVISLFLWSIPFVGRFSMPIPFVGARLTFFEVALSCIFRSAYVLSGGLNWSLSIEAFSTSPLLVDPHWVATFLELMVGFTKQWTMLLIPPVIHIIECAYAEDPITMTRFIDVAKQALVTPILNATGNSDMPVAQLLDSLASGPNGGASKVTRVVRCQMAAMNSILLAVMTIMSLFRMQFYNVYQFICYVYAMKMRLRTTYEARSCYRDIFMKIRSYLPGSMIGYYDMIGGYLSQFADM